MPGFDFGIIGEALHSVMDTDLVDIYRDAGDGNGRSLLYGGEPCHIAIVRADGADPRAVDAMPVSSMLQVNMPLGVDVQNGDYLAAKKCAADGTALMEYHGVCGHPAVSMSRKHVFVETDALE